MSDEVRVTSDERESPRPWRLGDETTHPNFVEDANGRVVASWCTRGDAELIVRAVNGREDLLKARGTAPGKELNGSTDGPMEEDNMDNMDNQGDANLPTRRRSSRSTP